MSGIDLITGLYLLAAAIISGMLSWLIRGRQTNQLLNQVGEDWQGRFDKTVPLTCRVASALCLNFSTVKTMCISSA